MNRVPELELVFEARLGAHLPQVAEQLASVASALMLTCKTKFNGDDLCAHPGQSAEAVLRDFAEAKEIRRKTREALAAARQG